MVYTCDKGSCNVKVRAKLVLDHHSDGLWVKICIWSVVQSHNALSADFTSRLLTFLFSPSVYTFKYKVAC